MRGGGFSPNTQKHKQDLCFITKTNTMCEYCIFAKLCCVFVLCASTTAASLFPLCSGFTLQCYTELSTAHIQSI